MPAREGRGSNNDFNSCGQSRKPGQVLMAAASAVEKSRLSQDLVEMSKSLGYQVTIGQVENSSKSSHSWSSGRAEETLTHSDVREKRKTRRIM